MGDNGLLQDFLMLCPHGLQLGQYETFRILIRTGHLKCSFYLHGTQLAAMATLLLRRVHCLFSENVKIISFSVISSSYIKHRFRFGIST